MAVTTHDLALCDLSENALPVSIRKRAADVERLVGEVVELEDDRVSLPAVQAGVLGEVLEQVLGPFEVEGLLPGVRLIDVALLVLR